MMVMMAQATWLMRLASIVGMFEFYPGYSIKKMMIQWYFRYRHSRKHITERVWEKLTLSTASVSARCIPSNNSLGWVGSTLSSHLETSLFSYSLAWAIKYVFTKDATYRFVFPPIPSEHCIGTVRCRPIVLSVSRCVKEHTVRCHVFVPGKKIWTCSYY